MRKKKQNEAALTRAQAMACIPVKGRHVQESRLESGEIRLAYPDTRQPWFGGLLRRLAGPGGDRVQVRKLQLDALGTSVWELLDGKRTVLEIVELFAAKYRLHPKEAEVSVSQFLRELGRRELIGLR